jgi:hypothetical protein
MQEEVTEKADRHDGNAPHAGRSSLVLNKIQIAQK